VSRDIPIDGQGKGLRIGIVISRFNEFITSKLLMGTKAALASHGVCNDDISVAWVPGSFELPVVAKKMAESGQYDSLICLGAIIRGETDHYAYVAGEAARGVSNVSLSTGIPAIFGILTTDTVDQAIERSGGIKDQNIESPRLTSKSPDATNGNIGYNAGVAAVELANLLRALDED